MNTPKPTLGKLPTASTSDPASQSLENIIKNVHPLMAEAFYIAALPHWYDLDVFTAIRNKDDERNQGLIPRLERYSFILPRPDNAEPTFRARETERRILNEQWITENASSYVAAHQRAHRYWQAHKDTATDDAHELTDEITCEQNQLYHYYFVNLPHAANQLGTIFRSYYGERLLDAAERSLHVANEARNYLHLLYSPDSSRSLSSLMNSKMRLISLGNMQKSRLASRPINRMFT